MEMLKIIVGVPETHEEVVRRAMGEAGAGKIGNYDFCSFTFRGIGRFRPLSGAHPAIGMEGEIAEVPEVRIQSVCLRADLSKIVLAIKSVHPYETPPIEV